jgi:phosphoglycolate phosphatase-like HAD superfamily hydrolase
MAGPSIAVCDLDGTLLDSDAALLAPFLALGVPAERIGFGRPVDEECVRHGVSVDDYLARYDTEVVQPFPGVAEVVARLDRWAVCSNKHPVSGRAELTRLRWHTEVALFTDAFDGPKTLGPVLTALGVGPPEVVFLGDTAHDRACARDAGATFALAAWNPRARPEVGDIVLARPEQLLELLGSGNA